VVHHIGHLGRLSIHRIVPHARPAFGLACRYVPIAIGIGASALVPPVAIPAAPVPVVSSPHPGGADDYGGPSSVPNMLNGSGGSGSFGPQEAGEQALLSIPSGTPVEFAADTGPTSEDLPWNLTLGPDSDAIQPIGPPFSTTNSPGEVATSAPTTPPIQSVSEPPAIALMLPALLAVVVLCRPVRLERRYP
jgi:hypothetical protein